MPEAKHLTSPTQYASRGDFCRVFYEETDNLYRLSFMLTADSEKAQECFVSGLENSVNGNPVFKDWARSWARRAIIQNAVRIINPRPTEENAPSDSSTDGRTLANGQPEIAAVLDLAPFERFVLRRGARFRNDRSAGSGANSPMFRRPDRFPPPPLVRLDRDAQDKRCKPGPPRKSTRHRQSNRLGCAKIRSWKPAPHPARLPRAFDRASTDDQK